MRLLSLMAEGRQSSQLFAFLREVSCCNNSSGDTSGNHWMHDRFIKAPDHSCCMLLSWEVPAQLTGFLANISLATALLVNSKDLD